MHFLRGSKILIFLDMQREKTCVLKYTSLSKFLHWNTYFSLYTRSYRKNPEKYSQSNCIFLQNLKTYANKWFLFRHKSSKVFRNQIQLFFRGQILANCEEICKKYDFLNLKYVYWNPTTEVTVSNVYLCENLWCTNKKILTAKMHFFGGKTWRKREKEDFWFKMSLSKFLQRSISFLVSVKL